MQEFYTFQSKNLQFECLLRRTSQDESEIDLEMPKEWNRAAKWRDDIAVVDGSEIRQKQWDKGRNYLLIGAGFYFFCFKIRHLDGQVIG